MSHSQTSTGGELTASKSNSSLFGKFNSLKKKKKLTETKSFVVQYLGNQGVNKVDGLDMVRPVVQVGVSSQCYTRLHYYNEILCFVGIGSES